MNILALETSTERLSLALLRGERLFVRDIDAGQRHSELALDALHGLLEEAGVTIAQLDAIAFGQGPGSFVGVRIACGLAQGLALGADKGLLPVSGLLALAEQAGAERVLAVNDARMGEFYLAAYERDSAQPSGWRTCIEPMLATRHDLPPLPDGQWHAIGSAFDVPDLAAILRAAYGSQVHDIEHGAFPSAGAMAQIAARQLNSAGPACLIAAAEAAPLYLRNKVAMTIAERRAAKDHSVEKVSA
jgi:tRNA threonylcarbamoyladenosine biosynthesis protein TsaB